MRTLALIVAALTVTACTAGRSVGPGAPGPIYLGTHGNTLNDIWTQLGKLEVALCFDAREVESGGWEITRVVIPPQSGDSVSASFDCEDYPGWGHNHPMFLEMNRGVPNCTLSAIDMATLTMWRTRFHILWCAPNTMIGTKIEVPR